MFLRIQPEELVPGIKYKIDNVVTFVNEYIELIVETNTKTGIFKRKVYRLHGKLYMMFYSEGKKRYFASDCMFYKFISENPQEKMERRAVNIIVRQIIGDHCFEW